MMFMGRSQSNNVTVTIRLDETLATYLRQEYGQGNLISSVIETSIKRMIGNMENKNKPCNFCFWSVYRADGTFDGKSDTRCKFVGSGFCEYYLPIMSVDMCGLCRNFVSTGSHKFKGVCSKIDRNDKQCERESTSSCIFTQFEPSSTIFGKVKMIGADGKMIDNYAKVIECLRSMRNGLPVLPLQEHVPAKKPTTEHNIVFDDKDRSLSDGRSDFVVDDTTVRTNKKKKTDKVDDETVRVINDEKIDMSKYT